MTSLGRALRSVASHSLISELLSCVAVSSVVRLCSRRKRSVSLEAALHKCNHAPMLLHAAHVQCETRRPKSLKHAFIRTARALIDAAKLHGTVQFGDPTAPPIAVGLSHYSGTVRSSHTASTVIPQWTRLSRTARQWLFTAVKSSSGSLRRYPSCYRMPSAGYYSWRTA